MKKLLCVLMMMSVLLSGAMGGAAEGAAGSNADLLLGDDVWISSSAYAGGRLYLSGDGKFLSYTPGAKELTKLEVDDRRTGQEGAEGRSFRGVGGEVYYNFSLFSDGDQLYGIESWEKAVICPLAVEGDTVIISDGAAIDTEALMSAEGYVESPMQTLGFMGRLYLIKRTWGANMELGLLSYDIEKGGEPQVHEAEFIWRLAPYQDGRLLALVMDPDESWDEKAKENKNYMLCAYDPQADSLEEIGDSGLAFSFESSGLAYNDASETIYLQGKSEVYLRDSAGVSRIGAYLTPSQYGGNSGDGLFLMGDGRIVLVRGKDIAVRDADSGKLPETRLTIYGSYMDEVHQKTISALGGIPVSFMDNKWFESAQQLGQALVSGEDNIDILMISADYIDVNNLMSKGYAVDLSGRQALQDYVAGLYPMMQDIGKYDGKLFMVPVDMSSNGLFSYYTKLVEGVEGFELPRTYDELVSFIQQWNDGWGEEYPDYVPMQEDDYKASMVRLAISMQKDLMAFQGKEFSYSDPQLKMMLEKAMALRTDDIAAKVDWESPDAQAQSEAIYSKAPLLQPYYWMELNNMNSALSGSDEGMMIGWGSGDKVFEVGREMPLQLAAREGEEPVAGISLTVMAVNPKSRNIDSAIAYMEEYLKNMDPARKTMLNPGLNDDIPNPNYEQEIKWMDESIAYYEEALKTAEGAEKTELENGYERMKKDMESRREQARYSVRKETIAFYRELMENSYIRTYDPATNSQEMNSLISRLIQGQMPIDQFAMEADGKLRLMRLEGQ